MMINTNVFYFTFTTIGGVGPEKMGQKRVSGSVSAQNRPKSQNGNTKSGRSVLKSKTDMVSARARGVKPKKNEKIRVPNGIL